MEGSSICMALKQRIYIKIVCLYLVFYVQRVESRNYYRDGYNRIP